MDQLVQKTGQFAFWNAIAWLYALVYVMAVIIRGTSQNQIVLIVLTMIYGMLLVIFLGLNVWLTLLAKKVDPEDFKSFRIAWVSVFANLLLMMIPISVLNLAVLAFWLVGWLNLLGLSKSIMDHH